MKYIVNLFDFLELYLMKFSNYIIILNCVFLGACTGPLKLYSGPSLPKQELSHIYLISTPNIGSSLHIRVTQVDERDFVKDPPSYFQAYVTPGIHKIRASFIDYDLSPEVIIGVINVKERHFQGYYNFDFTTQPNKSYVAMFDLNTNKKNWPEKMCIYERETNMSNAGNKGNIILCSEPSIPTNEDSIKLCKTHRNLSKYLNPIDTNQENCTVTQ